MIARGSSDRGLSLVTTVRSASSAAVRPIIGRFARSRSPPQPNTTITRPVGQRTCTPEHAEDAIRRVCVVHYHRELLPCLDRLHPAGHAAARPRSPRAAVVERDPERRRGGDERPRQFSTLNRPRRALRTATPSTVEPRSRRRSHLDVASHGRRRRRRRRSVVDGDRAGPRAAAVPRDRRRSRRRGERAPGVNSRAFAVEVRLHRTVEVEVVLGQVREHGDVDDERRRPDAARARATRSPSRRRRTPAARIRARSRWRSGASGVVCASGDRLAVDPETGRADHAGPSTRRPGTPPPAGRSIVVLPFVPVTPTSGHRRGRVARTRSAAIGPIASRTERTTSCGDRDVERALDHEAPRARVDRLLRRRRVRRRARPGMQKKSAPARHGARVVRRVAHGGVCGSPRTSAPTVAATSASRTWGKVASTAREPTRPGSRLREPASACGGSADGGARLDAEPLDRVPRDVLEQRCGGDAAVDRVGLVEDRGDHDPRLRGRQEPDERGHVAIDVVARRCRPSSPSPSCPPPGTRRSARRSPSRPGRRRRASPSASALVAVGQDTVLRGAAAPASNVPSAPTVAAHEARLDVHTAVRDRRVHRRPSAAARPRRPRRTRPSRV